MDGKLVIEFPQYVAYFASKFKNVLLKEKARVIVAARIFFF